MSRFVPMNERRSSDPGTIILSVVASGVYWSARHAAHA
jgi:hypothetical protein